MLTTRILVSVPADPQPEDILQSTLSTLFTNDTRNSHGDPGEHLIYQSPHYGDIRICLPVTPDVEASRQLFAHHMWNAGVVAADMIEQASHCGQRISSTSFWNVTGERVLELGAGGYARYR